MNIYYKITNKEEIHYGYKYIDGLNVLNEPFNENMDDACGSGGLYFTDAININNFYEFGENLRVIELPINNPDFKMLKFDNKYRANMIILKEKYNFNNLEDIKKIIKINKDVSYFIKFACLNNRIDILDFLKENTDKSMFINDTFINKALLNGNVKMLEWCYDNKIINKNTSRIYSKIIQEFIFKQNYTQYIEQFISHNFNFANRNDVNLFQIAINLCRLDILKIIDTIVFGNIVSEFYNYMTQRNGLDLKKYKFNIEEPSKNGNVDILNFLINNKYEINFSENIITIVSEHGHIHLLDFFYKNKYFEYDFNAIDKACLNGHVNVLEWFFNSGCLFKYGENAFNNACKNNQFDILIWFKKHNLKYTITVQTLRIVFENGNLEILKLISNLNGFYEAINLQKLYDIAISFNHIHILEWLKENYNLKIKCNIFAIEKICEKGFVDMLEWLKNNSDFKYTSYCLRLALKNNKIEVLEWFKNNYNFIFYYQSSMNYECNDETLKWLYLNGVETKPEIYF